MVIVLAAVAVGYFLFAAVGDALLSHQLDREERQLRLDIAELQRQQLELEAIRDYLNTDAYIEGVARRILGLVRPGETLVIVSSTAPATPTPADQETETNAKPRRWWEELYIPPE